MSHSLSMQQGQRQSLKQSQRLMMSPQMQQALNLLQVPIMELATLVEAELEQNPVLEEMSPHEGGEEFSDDLSGSDNGAEQNPESELSIDDRDFEILRRLDEDMRDHFAESGGYAAKRSQEEEKLRTFLESSVQSKEGRFSNLMAQVAENFSEPKEIQIAQSIVGNLDERGFFDGRLEEIAALEESSIEEVEAVLLVVRSFDPPGIAAGSQQDSLLIQLERKRKKESLAYRIIEECYGLMLQNKIPAIAQALGVGPVDVQQEIANEIAVLELHPGGGDGVQGTQWITADLRIYLDDEVLKVEMPEGGMPSLRLNRTYLKMLEDESLKNETKEYIKNKVLSGKWLLKNICQRNDTLYRIAEQLIEHQREFLSDPEGKLVPLTMKVVADAIEVHESTVARAVANKYVDTPRGLLPLRQFFTNALVNTDGEEVSSSTVKEALRDILAKEDKGKPLSDEALSKCLKERGINCARRTVAKYRVQFGIGNTSQRRVWTQK